MRDSETLLTGFSSGSPMTPLTCEVESLCGFGIWSPRASAWYTLLFLHNRSRLSSRVRLPAGPFVFLATLSITEQRPPKQSLSSRHDRQSRKFWETSDKTTKVIDKSSGTGGGGERVEETGKWRGKKRGDMWEKRRKKNLREAWWERALLMVGPVPETQLSYVNLLRKGYYNNQENKITK